MTVKRLSTSVYEFDRSPHNNSAMTIDATMKIPPMVGVWFFVFVQFVELRSESLAMRSVNRPLSASESQTDRAAKGHQEGR